MDRDTRAVSRRALLMAFGRASRAQLRATREIRSTSAAGEVVRALARSLSAKPARPQLSI